MYILNDSNFWNKISADWWQKVSTTKNGKLVYEYHYQNKSSKRAIVFEIDTKIAKQYSGYSLIEKDLRDILLMIEEYKKISIDEKLSSNGILQKALIKAIIITYGKCFAETNGRIKLEKSKIFTREKDVEEHEKIMNVRHEYIAHAGSSGFEHCKCVLLFPSETKYAKGHLIEVNMAAELSQVITNKNINEIIIHLTEKVHKWVKEKIKSLNKLLFLDMENITPEEFYRLSKKNVSRIVLNNKMLVKMSKKFRD